LKYEFRDIKRDNPTLEELTAWYKKSEVPLKRFFNTSGKIYRDLDLKNRLEDMSEEEQLSLLSTDGMLVKRPILVKDNIVLVGFKEEEWKDALLMTSP
jgi:arsenate reductase